MTKRQSDISEIGYWSEIKLDIIEEYASVYSTILTAQDRPALKHVYIDGFSGAGFHVAKARLKVRSDCFMATCNPTMFCLT